VDRINSSRFNFDKVKLPLDSIRMKYIIYGFFLLSAACFCEILSTNGKIQFDAQADEQPKITLNSTGLGIGTSSSTNLHVIGNATHCTRESGHIWAFASR